MKIGKRTHEWSDQGVKQFVREINGKRFMFTGSKRRGVTIVVVTRFYPVGPTQRVKLVRF